MKNTSVITGSTTQSVQTNSVVYGVMFSVALRAFVKSEKITSDKVI